MHRFARPFRSVVTKSTLRGSPVVRVESGFVRPGMVLKFFPSEISGEVDCIRRLKSGVVGTSAQPVGLQREEVELTLKSV